MNFSFPIEGVRFAYSEIKNALASTFLIEDGVYVSQNEIQFDIEDFGIFYIKNGDSLDFFPYSKQVNKELFDLYVKGPVFGAILLQRKVLTFHGSAVRYKDKAILFCGDSGSGKSTCALSFCQDGAKLLNDDVSPITFDNQEPFVLGFSDKIRLWKDTFDTLEILTHNKTKVWSEDERDKYYLELDSEEKQTQLKIVFILKLSTKLELKVLNKSESLSALRNQIYRKEYLPNMKETEKAFFLNIILLTKKCQVVEVKRPTDIHPHLLKIELDKFLENL